MDHRLIELLVCPICKGALQMLRNDAGVGVELMCRADHVAFPIRDGIPVMLEDEARSVEAAPPPTPPLASNP